VSWTSVAALPTVHRIQDSEKEEAVVFWRRKSLKKKEERRGPNEKKNGERISESGRGKNRQRKTRIEQKGRKIVFQARVLGREEIHSEKTVAVERKRRAGGRIRGSKKMTQYARIAGGNLLGPSNYWTGVGGSGCPCQGGDSACRRSYAGKSKRAEQKGNAKGRTTHLTVYS